MPQEYGIDDLRSFDHVSHELYLYLPICSSTCELTIRFSYCTNGLYPPTIRKSGHKDSLLTEISIHYVIQVYPSVAARNAYTNTFVTDP